jgi:hypothetical protein
VQRKQFTLEKSPSFRFLKSGRNCVFHFSLHRVKSYKVCTDSLCFHVHVELELRSGTWKLVRYQEDCTSKIVKVLHEPFDCSTGLPENCGFLCETPTWNKDLPRVDAFRLLEGSAIGWGRGKSFGAEIIHAYVTFAKLWGGYGGLWSECHMKTTTRGS